MADTIKAAIIGSGNIVTDLMMKMIKYPQNMELAVVVGIDAASEGLAMARSHGIQTTHEGLEGLMALDVYPEIGIVFDATSAYAHKVHDAALRKDGKLVVDLTPAAIGPFTIPPVNMEENLASGNVNMVTCGGQATIPMVAAVSQVAKVHYAEIVASVSSRSAGPGTRANIDEFTRTTARAIEKVGGAEQGKAIIILNPAEPPMIMRDTVFTLSEGADEETIRASVEAMVGTTAMRAPFRTAATLAVSAVLPPPIPATTSAPASATSAATRSISSVQHSPPKSSIRASIPASAKDRRIAAS